MRNRVQGERRDRIGIKRSKEQQKGDYEQLVSSECAEMAQPEGSKKAIKTRGMQENK